jgi:hypothetical protein
MKAAFPIALSLGLLFAWASQSAHAQSRQTFRFEEEVIVGKVHKPEVMMVITRQNLEGTYSLELRESFLPKIVRSVEQEPF